MKSLTILCDMDGILVDLCTNWFTLLNERYGTTTTIDDIDQWSTHKCGDYAKKLTAAQVYGMLREPGTFRNAPPIPGGPHYLKRLHDDGHKIVIVSSPSGGLSAKEKYEWLAEYTPWLKEEQIILASQKVLVKGDVLIDDRAETLTEYALTWFDALCLGIEYPYNRGMEQVPGWIELKKSYRVPEAAWKGIYNRITEEAER